MSNTAAPPRRAFSYTVICYTPGTAGERLSERGTRIVARSAAEARATAREVLDVPEGDVVLVTEAMELNPDEARGWNDWHLATITADQTTE